MELCFYMFQRCRPQWESQCCCGSSFVHIEGSAAGDASAGFLGWLREIRMFSAEREVENTRKSECWRVRRSRCRAKGGVGGGYTPPIQRGFTRHAGYAYRGGSTGLRPFRRGREGEQQQQQQQERSSRRKRFGVTFMHVCAPAAI